ncbi:Dabb family protein [Lentisphaera profundi]|uniref:Dabb family protein n=1 Tax=Lentisphaera profundi TaxID=1658616 RepID=A0ABY7VVS7_9BACT|nr:Dabb family protein [Lentisphaera profundi]WDE97379.1 Dabb family protein [Lentisphaera profundi]
MKKIILILAMLLFASCANHSKPDPRIVHVVFAWLNEPGNEKHREMIIKASEEFLKIPGVLDVGVGAPLMSDRSVVDDSFDVGIFLTFKTKEDLQAYIDHPDHQATVKLLLKPLSKKITVYDIVDL